MGKPMARRSIMWSVRIEEPMSLRDPDGEEFVSWE